MAWARQWEEWDTPGLLVYAARGKGMRCVAAQSLMEPAHIRPKRHRSWFSYRSNRVGISDSMPSAIANTRTAFSCPIYLRALRYRNGVRKGRGRSWIGLGQTVRSPYLSSLGLGSSFIF